MVKSLFAIIFFIYTLFFCQPVMAHEEPIVPLIEAKVVNIIEEKEIEIDGGKQLYQKIELRVTKGQLKDKIVEIENGNQPLVNIIKYQVNDRVLIMESTDYSGKTVYNITDFMRRDSLILLFLIFLVLTILIAKKRGASSILSMGITFLVIFKFILPKISDGQDPILIASLGSLIIIPNTFYLAHGFSRKTTVAVISTLIAITITGVLASIFVNIGRLTGLSSEEAGFLSLIKQGSINMKGLLLAGIMIGAVGVLDDITIAQAGIVEELKKASNKLKTWDLYSRAMNVGQDHITSMVNTLILVYAGASLPLLLMFIDNPHPFVEIVNYEFIAEEIIRTLVGSIGLMTAVPITTLLASILLSGQNQND